MTLVNWGFLHCMNMKYFLLRNIWSDFEIISQECSLGDLLQILFANFDPSVNMALVNGGFLHYTDLKKYLNNLRRNRWSDFEIISQESGFDISGHCTIRAIIARGKLPSPFVNPKGKVKIFGLLSSIRVFIADTSSFWTLRSDKQMDIKLFTEFLRQNDLSKNMAFMEDSFSSYGTK